MKRYKLSCLAVEQVAMWDGQVLWQARFRSAETGVAPVPVSVAGDGGISLGCGQYDFRAGQAYYVTFETAEAIVDKQG